MRLKGGFRLKAVVGTKIYIKKIYGEYTWLFLTIKGSNDKDCFDVQMVTLRTASITKKRLRTKFEIFENIRDHLQ